MKKLNFVKTPKNNLSNRYLHIRDRRILNNSDFAKDDFIISVSIGGLDGCVFETMLVLEVLDDGIIVDIVNDDSCYARVEVGSKAEHLESGVDILKDDLRMYNCMLNKFPCYVEESIKLSEEERPERNVTSGEKVIASGLFLTGEVKMFPGFLLVSKGLMGQPDYMLVQSVNCYACNYVVRVLEEEFFDKNFPHLNIPEKVKKELY